MIHLENDSFRAGIYPEVGANLAELIHKPTGCPILRSPADAGALREEPCVYGLPVLMPPNRIAKGVFTFDGREYHFPINDNRGLQNHLHGLLYNREWQVVEAGKDRATLAYESSPESPFRSYFDLDFRMELTYTLDDGGLLQEIRFINRSERLFPFALGFHTTFNVGPEDRSRIALGEFRYPLDPATKLNRGEQIPLKEFAPFREGAVSEELFLSGHTPIGKPINCHGAPLRGAVIERKAFGIEVTYRLGPGFSHWMMWNKEPGSGFFCIEPQTCMVDVFNQKLPPETTGLIVLQPGEEWRSFTCIGVARDESRMTNCESLIREAGRPVKG